MSLADKRARTAARRAAGEPQTYPEHAAPRAAPAPAQGPSVALPVLPPCVHEGIVLEHCHTCRGEARSVRACDLHERCTREFVSDRVRSCDRCADHSPDPAG